MEQKILSAIKAIPKPCWMCHKIAKIEQGSFCPECWREILQQIRVRGACQRRVDDGFRVRSALEYRHKAALFVKKIKRQRRIEGWALGFLQKLVQHFSQDWHGHFDVVVPMPSNPYRCLLQSDLSMLLGLLLAENLQLPLRSDFLLMRWDAFRLQKNCSLPERQRLAEEKFYVNRRRFAKQLQTGAGRILLVDDVMSSSSSLRSARKRLMEAGAGEKIQIKQAFVLAEAGLEDLP